MRCWRTSAARLATPRAAVVVCSPIPKGDYEAYDFCPWCSLSIRGREPRIDESRKIIQHVRCGNDEIQCGECGGEYNQPTLYPFLNCPHCGALFAAQDELLIELPILV